MDFDDELNPSPDNETQVRKVEGRETLTTGANSRKEPPPWDIGHVMGGFRLEKLLGQGNSGYVFRATELETNETFPKTYALKILVNEEEIARNRIGVRRMMGLVHPNLVQVYRIHDLGPHGAFSMQEVNGTTFCDRMRLYKRLHPHIAYSRLISLIRQYASALSVMHGNHLVHRDIKPANLMVDGDENGWVIDYGLVGTYDSEKDPKGFRSYLAGSPRYFAPEVVFEQSYLPAGDIFSLGLVTLEAVNAIAGKVALRRDDGDRDSDAQLIGEAVGELNISVPAVLRDACEEMLERKPGNRPTAHEISRLGLPGTRKHFVVSGQIYGRDQEQQTADEWLQSIYNGKPGQLHIHGPAGVGKSCLVNEIVRQMKGTNWGQVFHVKCRPHGDRSNETLNDLADQIAHRYAAPDRPSLVLDTVTASVIEQTCPVLKGVIKVDYQLQSPASKSSNQIALDASIRVAHELMKVGPLILVVEDIHWASRETLLLIDRWRTIDNAMLGIITVSRGKEANQKHAPSEYLEVKPISHDASVNWLAIEARRSDARISDDVIDALATAAGGFPLRLMELAQEFRQDDMLAELSSLSEPDPEALKLDQLWKKRAKRLSANAQKALLYLANASGPISGKQLSMLMDWTSTEIEDAVSQLVDQKLAIDDATYGQCISMVHDQITQGVLENIDEDQRRKAHLDWAEALAGQSDALQNPGQIARHFFDAEEPSRGLSFAISAAEQAKSSLRFQEAANWFTSILSLVVPSEKNKYMRFAAECYLEAESFGQAADMYLELAEQNEAADDSLELRELAAELLIRAGRVTECKKVASEIFCSLGFDQIGQTLRFDEAHNSAGLDPKIFGAWNADQHSQQLAFKLCVSVLRPMALFDRQYAEAMVLSADEISHTATLDQQFQNTLNGLVLSALRGEKVGDEYHRSMQLLKGIADKRKNDDGNLRAQHWAMSSVMNVVQGNWNEVAVDADRCRNLFRSSGQSWRFERVFVDAFAILAHSKLGQWKLMQAIGSTVHHDALCSNNQLASFLSSSGPGVLSFLYHDNLKQWKRFQSKNESMVDDSRGQLASLLHHYSVIQHHIYSGQFHSAWRQYRLFSSEFRSVELPVIRASLYEAGALIAAHRASESEKTKWTKESIALCEKLSETGLPHAMAASLLIKGLVMRSKDQDQARESLEQAKQLARDAMWKPIHLAAVDAIYSLDPGEWTGRLREAMRRDGVEEPERFERLYTVPLGEREF